MAYSITEVIDDLLADCDRLKDECGTLRRKLDRLGDQMKHQQRMREMLLKLSDPDLPESVALEHLKWCREAIREWSNRA